jgi:hypothetical protein
VAALVEPETKPGCNRQETASSDRKTGRIQVTTVPPQRTLRFAAVIRENLYEFVIGERMKAVYELLKQDRERLCGTAYTRRAATALLCVGGRRTDG